MPASNLDSVHTSGSTAASGDTFGDPRVDTATLRRMAAANATALVLGYLPMARWEQRMRATGGPGIVGLQLARDTGVARAILSTWGVEGRRAATEQTWADFVWMQTYGITGAYVVELARRRAAPASGWARAGRVVRWLPHAAVACDVVEGVGQLRTLRSWQDPGEGTVRMTRVAATAKYALLGAAALWAVGAATIGARRPE
ncbi:MAG: hypothetical protein ABR500_07830 [Dermatophilaceae bacterium]|nr:hypothetical protein [Intrasporangiaceae bacterium]